MDNIKRLQIKIAELKKQIKDCAKELKDCTKELEGSPALSLYQAQVKANRIAGQMRNGGYSIKEL